MSSIIYLFLVKFKNTSFIALELMISIGRGRSFGSLCGKVLYGLCTLWPRLWWDNCSVRWYLAFYLLPYTYLYKLKKYLADRIIVWQLMAFAKTNWCKLRRLLFIVYNLWFCLFCDILPDSWLVIDNFHKTLLATLLYFHWVSTQSACQQ